jgi:LacI family transcriptional regulator
VTLTEVAGRAGVSPSTASHILNGQSARMRIATDTQERVRRVADELGYRANRSARSLRTRRTATIGLVCDFVSGGPYSGRMLRGASAAARDLGHLLLIGESEGDPDVEIGLVEEMVARQVDGILYTTVDTSEVRLPLTLHQHRVVLLNCVDPTVSVPAVLPDDEDAGRAVARLLASGPRTAGGVVLVGAVGPAGARRGPAASYATTRRLRALTASLRAAGLRVTGSLPCDEDVAAAEHAVAVRLNRSHPGRRPAALVCSDDRVAVGAHRAVQAVGLEVPGDVMLVVLEGSVLSESLRLATPHVVTPYAEMGALAVRRLLEDAPGRPAPGVMTVPTSLRTGGAPLPVAEVIDVTGECP